MVAVAAILVIPNSSFTIPTTRLRGPFRAERFRRSAIDAMAGSRSVRKLIAFHDDTFDKLKQLARDRMSTLQELAEADLLKSTGSPST
jgi:hypothetical protein